jgi:2-amino-4-hydroxy-6-hydroxymethyldihydropteridine diphosphokinase
MENKISVIFDKINKIRFLKNDFRMNVAYLLLGGNLGKRVENLSLAQKFLTNEGLNILTASSIFETAPWGMNSTTYFLNKVIGVECNLSVMELLNTCLKVEKMMGRQRSSEHYQSRIIDIDILFFNDEVILTEELKVPHPRLHERRFVLVPLSEIAPKFVHPVLKKTTEELLQICKDQLEVKKFI